jgi:hypothetical protein
VNFPDEQRKNREIRRFPRFFAALGGLTFQQFQCFAEQFPCTTEQGNFEKASREGFA